MRKGGDGRSESFIFRKKRKQKPLTERFSKSKLQGGGQPALFAADPYGSGADFDDLGELDGSDEGDECESEPPVGVGHFCGLKRSSTWEASPLSREQAGKKEGTRRRVRDELAMTGASVRRVAQLAEFKAEHGHTWVSTDQHSKFYVKGLGGWVLAQRRARRRGEINEQLEDALEDLGFSWEGPRASLSKESPADAAGGRARGWRGCESELDREDGDTAEAAAAWNADDDELDEPEDNEPGGGLWGCGSDTNGGHPSSYGARASLLQEDGDGRIAAGEWRHEDGDAIGGDGMGHLQHAPDGMEQLHNQLHMSSMDPSQHPSALALVRVSTVLVRKRKRQQHSHYHLKSRSSPHTHASCVLRLASCFAQAKQEAGKQSKRQASKARGITIEPSHARQI